MSTDRKLSAIMFTDIVAFTATMQTDEDKAIQLRNLHRKILDKYHARFNGKVINYMGDGTLSIFDSSRDAVECAMEMQKAFNRHPTVPVKIGIHLGEILLIDDDIAGDSVNRASRIESMAVAGSILISSKVFDDIKNQNWIETVSLGLHEFKNVEKAEEVFAVSNDGLKLPDINKLGGKLKSVKAESPEQEPPSNFIKKLWRRKVLSVLGLYLISLWMLNKVAEAIIMNYPVSPYWSDLIVVLFLSLLPTVLIHTYHHKKLELLKPKMSEKITIPFNIMLTTILMVSMFYGKDLGATNKTILSVDEFGNQIKRNILKPEFKSKLYIFQFKNETKDASLNWLEQGMPFLIFFDLLQDNFFWLNISQQKNSLGEMIQNAKEHYYPHFLTGYFQKTNDSFLIVTQYYDTKNGKLVYERTSKGKDIFELCDSLTHHLKSDLRLPDFHTENCTDLPIKTIVTDSINAYESHIKAYYQKNSLENAAECLIKANKIDSTFAINNYFLATSLYDSKSHTKESKEAINRAMKFRNRLPEIFRIWIQIYYYRINNSDKKALALSKLKVELSPEDYKTNYILIDEYCRSGNYQMALNVARKAFNLLPHQNDLILKQVWLLKLLNRHKEALRLILKYTDKYPNDPEGYTRLIDIFLATEDVENAKKTAIKASLLAPENTTYPLILKHINYIQNKQNISNDNIIQYLGEYRSLKKIWIDKIILKNNNLYIDNKTLDLYQLYQLDNNTFTSLKFDGFKLQFFRNKKGKIYKYKIDISGNIYEYYLHTQKIKTAEKLLLDGKDEEALEAYENAYLKNPEHYFLKNFVQHLKFKKTNTYQSLYSNPNLNNFSIVSNKQRITYEKGKFYFWEISNGLKFPILPISTEEFIIMEKWSAIIKLKRDKGKVIGFDFRYI